MIRHLKFPAGEACAILNPTVSLGMRFHIGVGLKLRLIANVHRNRHIELGTRHTSKQLRSRLTLPLAPNPQRTETPGGTGAKPIARAAAPDPPSPAPTPPPPRDVPPKECHQWINVPYPC